jgi:hypothetical protein
MVISAIRGMRVLLAEGGLLLFIRSDQGPSFWLYYTSYIHPLTPRQPGFLQWGCRHVQTIRGVLISGKLSEN